MANKIATTFLLVVAGFTTPVFAFGHTTPGWYEVTRGGYTYWMPPSGPCTSGYLPKHVTLYKSLHWLTSHFSTPGRLTFGELYIDSYGPKIYIANDVPAIVQHDTLIHEEAELRGCGDDPVDWHPN